MDDRLPRQERQPTVQVPNSSLLSASRSTLDLKGTGVARFQAPKVLGPLLLGFTFYHSFITFIGNTIHMASNPIPVRLVR